MGDLLWLHSGGSFNKEPENDLGNYPSRFDLGGEPPGEPNVMNNLFDDIVPEEAKKGMIDYRCIYFWNPAAANAITDVQVDIAQCEECIPSGILFHGSILQNDIQEIVIDCTGYSTTPDIGGYVIFSTEFGAPFTVYWTEGGWAQFKDDLQARLNALAWGSGIIVTMLGPGDFEIEFAGEVGNRNVCLMRVVQNDLTLKGRSRFHTETYFGEDPYNGFGDSIVRTVEPISDAVPQSGELHIYNPITGLWEAFPYNLHTSHEFILAKSLDFNMVGFKGTSASGSTGDVNYAENWQRHYPSPVYYGGYPNGQNLPLPVPWGVIDAPVSDKSCIICITKKQEGHPINTIAQEIPTDTTEPDDVTFTQTQIPVGNLRPNEGFYWWIKRETPSMSPPCLQHFVNLTVDAMKVTWPLQN